MVFFSGKGERRRREDGDRSQGYGGWGVAVTGAALGLAGVAYNIRCRGIYFAKYYGGGGWGNCWWGNK